MLYNDKFAHTVTGALVAGKESYGDELCAGLPTAELEQVGLESMVGSFIYSNACANGTGHGEFDKSIQAMLKGKRSDAVYVRYSPGNSDGRFMCAHLSAERELTILLLPLRAHPLHYAHSLDEALDVADQWRDELGDVGTSILQELYRQAKPLVDADGAVNCLFPTRKLDEKRQADQREVLAYLAAY